MKIFKVNTFLQGWIVASASLMTLSWTSVTTISGTGSYDPYVSVNGSGEAVAVWSNDTGTDVLTQAALFDGVYWQTYETISDNGLNIDPVAKIDASGNVVAAWELFNYGPRKIYVATKPVASSWSTPQQISTALTTSSLTMAMNNSGQTIVGWINNDTDTIEVATYTFGGSWSSVTPISSTGGIKGSLQLGIDSSGKGFAAWEEYDSASILVTQTTGDIETSWSAPVVISEVGMFTTPNLSVAPGGVAVLSWIDYNTYNIFAAVYEGGSWQSPETLTTSFAYWPVAKALDDTVFVSWQNLDTGNNQITRRVLGTWDTPTDISLTIPNDIPILSAAASSSHCGWTDLNTGQITVVDYAITGSPTTPVVISLGDLNLTPEFAATPALTVGVWMAIYGVDSTIDANVE